MNNEINNAYINALLADAAYVKNDEYFTSNLINRMTATQAQHGKVG